MAIVGLTASIIQLVDTGREVTEQIREFQHSLAFEHLNAKLPVLNLTLDRMMEAQNQERFDRKTQEVLLAAVDDCRALFAQLDALISRMTPAEKDSKLRKTYMSVRSFGKDKILKEIQANLEGSIDQLANYFAVNASLASRVNDLKLVQNEASLPLPNSIADKATFDVPAQQVSIFVGRKGLMEKIGASLAKTDPDSARPSVVVLVGMGGQGVGCPKIPFSFTSDADGIDRRLSWRLSIVGSTGTLITPSSGSMPPRHMQQLLRLKRSPPY